MIKESKLEKLPSGMDFFAAAVIAKPVSFFEQLLGTELKQYCDDLDYFRAAIFRTSKNEPFAIIQYRGGNPATTTIYVPARVHPYDEEQLTLIKEKFRAIQQELQIQDEEIVWHPGLNSREFRRRDT